MLENAKSKTVWEKGSGPQRVSHWGEHPLSWWRNKIKNYRGDMPPRLSIEVRVWDRAGKQSSREEFVADDLRGAKAFAKQWVDDTQGTASVRATVYILGEGDFTVEEFGEYKVDAPTAFYVWAVDSDFQPFARRGPWNDRDQAYREARDMAQRSETHHQVVTLGDDPEQTGFDVYKAFRARSGEVFLTSELGRAGERLGEYRNNPEYRSGRMLVDYDSYDVRGVLAGAYRGRDTMARPTLTHVVFKKDGHDLRCGCSQPIDNIVDPYGAQVAGTPPTCPRCLKIWEKLPRELEVSEGYLGREPNGLSDRPLAAKGLRSYRARGRYGWIMIGARDDAEALSEARRSTDDPRGLEVWDGSRYVPVSSRADERAKNGAGYYVWVVDSSSRPLAKEGPYGPYHTLEGAKPYARISATEGAHDRIISRGRDPRSDDFEIVRRYKARTGERVI
jgi:hypothetical protein